MTDLEEIKKILENEVACYQVDHYGHNIYLVKEDDKFRLVETFTSHFHTSLGVNIELPDKIVKAIQIQALCAVPQGDEKGDEKNERD